MKGEGLGRLLLPGVTALVAAMVACGGNGGGNGGGEAADGTAAAEAEAGSPAGARIRGDTVVVEMDEYLIDMPDTVPAGRLVFEVRNLGFEEHNLEIHRDSLLFESGRPLNPRETRHMEVELEPGPYRVVCTVSGHEGRGMTRGLTVAEGPPES